MLTQQPKSENSKVQSLTVKFDADVPCDGCRLCCEGGEAELEASDDPNMYETHQVNGRTALARQENGHCIYLDDKGCTIYEDRPGVCRHFDCRTLFKEIVGKHGEDLTWVDENLRDVIARGRELSPEFDGVPADFKAALTSGDGETEANGYFTWLAQPRLMPNTFLVGAMRAGTTMLWGGLSGSKQVGQSRLKELNYFDKGIERDINVQSYARMFPSIRHLKEGVKVIMEGSPGYLHYPLAMGRINAVLGRDPKILIMVRDPVERAISHFKWLKRYDFLPEDDLSRFRLAAGDEDEGYLYDTTDMIGETYMPAYHDIVARSVYDVQIRRAMHYFDNVLVISHEELMNNTTETLGKVTDFLEIDPVRFEFPPYEDKGNFDVFDVTEEDREWLKHRLAPSQNRLIADAMKW